MLVKNMILEKLLDKKYPNASFHDALLNNLILDYLSRNAEFHMELCVGDPQSKDADERETHAKKILIFKGFLFCILEAPDPTYNFIEKGGLWITGDGPISKLKSVEHADLLKRIPKDSFGHYFFNSDWNSFIYIAAQSAVFK